MLFKAIAVTSLLYITTVQATPTGNHTCTGVVKHTVTVRVNVTEPVTYRTYTWCLRVPPRCSKYTVQLKDRVKIHTELHNRTITVCCKGYVEMDYKCVPACPPQTECPYMHCNRTNHCYCTPGYQGLYCNYPCDRGFWGTDCKKPCDCPDGFICHHLTGDCMLDDRPPTSIKYRRTTTTAAIVSPETTITESTTSTTTAAIEPSTNPTTKLTTTSTEYSTTTVTTERPTTTEQPTSTEKLTTTYTIPTITATTITEEQAEIEKEITTITTITPTITTTSTLPTKPMIPTTLIITPTTTHTTTETTSPPLTEQTIVTTTTMLPISVESTTMLETSIVQQTTPTTKLSEEPSSSTATTIVMTGTTTSENNIPTSMHTILNEKTAATSSEPPFIIQPTMPNNESPTTTPVSVDFKNVPSIKIETSPSTEIYLSTMKTTPADFFNIFKSRSTNISEVMTTERQLISSPPFFVDSNGILSHTEETILASITEMGIKITAQNSEVNITTEASKTPAAVSTELTPNQDKNNLEISQSNFQSEINTTTEISSVKKQVNHTILTNNDKTISPSIATAIIETIISIPPSVLSTTTKTVSQVEENKEFVTKINADSLITTENTDVINSYFPKIINFPNTNVYGRRNEDPDHKNPTTMVTIEDRNATSPIVSDNFQPNSDQVIFKNSLPTEITSTLELTKSIATESSTSLPDTMSIGNKSNLGSTIESMFLRVIKEPQQVSENNDTEENSLKTTNVLRKPFKNDTNLSYGANEISTKFGQQNFDLGKSASETKTKLRTEATTTSFTTKDVNLQTLWSTTNSRPAHTWYSYVKERSQKKPKSKEELLKGMKTTSTLEQLEVTEKYDISEESNIIDSMQTTFTERGSKINSGPPPSISEDTNIATSYLQNGQLNYNLSSALVEEVQSIKNNNKSFFTIYSTSTLISGILLILIISTSTALWVCRRRKREQTTLLGPCIMAYGPPNEFTLSPLMYETVYPLEDEQSLEPEIFFCPTFTNNYAEKINREFSELNYDHPRSSFCEPLYAEIRY